MTVAPSEYYFNVENLDGAAANGKLQYISRDDPDIGKDRVPVYNRVGQEISDREKKEFLQKAECHDYVQRWQFSPPNGKDLDPDDIRRETRRVAPSTRRISTPQVCRGAREKREEQRARANRGRSPRIADATEGHRPDATDAHERITATNATATSTRSDRRSSSIR